MKKIKYVMSIQAIVEYFLTLQDAAREIDRRLKEQHILSINPLTKDQRVKLEDQKMDILFRSKIISKYFTETGLTFGESQIKHFLGSDLKKLVEEGVRSKEKGRDRIFLG